MRAMSSEFPILGESTLTTEGFYEHKPCGELLLRVRVAYEPPFALSTFDGEKYVTYGFVPYCGTCGPVPTGVTVGVAY